MTQLHRATLPNGLRVLVVPDPDTPVVGVDCAACCRAGCPGLLDGYKLLGLPETGINVDHTPGPRGPVTYPDLSLRQFVVLPPD